jgi:hypothetical protein
MARHKHTRGGTKLKPLIFFSENIITIIMKFTKLRFLHKVSFIINTFSPPLCETLYAGRVKLFAEALELYKHAVSRRRPQNGVLGVRPSEGKKMVVGGC